MNIYISKKNEAYLRSLAGPMSGHINFLLDQEREEAKAVKKHIVNEGKELGLIPEEAAKAAERKAVRRDTEAAVVMGIKHKNDVRAAEGVAQLKGAPTRMEGPVCKVHGLPLDNRGRCLQKGCKYA